MNANALTHIPFIFQGEIFCLVPRAFPHTLIIREHGSGSSFDELGSLHTVALMCVYTIMLMAHV